MTDDGNSTTDWDAMGMTARLDEDLWRDLDITAQTFAVMRTSDGTRWACPYSDLTDRPMSEDEFDAFVEAEGKYIDSFASEVEAGEWGPPPVRPTNVPVDDSTDLATDVSDVITSVDSPPAHQS